MFRIKGLKFDRLKFDKNIRAFTLIEAIVTMVIFIILLLISFGSYPRLVITLGYNSTVSAMLADIKSTQISGSSRGGDFAGDGVFFLMANPTNYVMYLDAADTPDLLGIMKSNKAYFAGGLDKIVKTFNLGNNVSINKLCVKNDTSIIKTCNPAFNSMSISFLRPNTNANITDYTNDPIDPTKLRLYDKAYIELTQNIVANSYKCIVVYRFGQIELKQGICDNY